MVVSEREVLAAIRAGARSVDDVGERCEAGTGCGSCRGAIAIVLAQQERRRTSRGEPIPEAVLAQLGLFGRQPRDDGPRGAHENSQRGATPSRRGR